MRKVSPEKQTRIDQMRELAAKGKTIQEIADAIGKSYDYTRLFASNNGIEIKKKPRGKFEKIERFAHGRESMMAGASCDARAILNRSWGSPA